MITKIWRLNMGVPGESQAESLETRFASDQILAAAQSLGEFVAELGLEHKGQSYASSPFFYTPRGSQIQIVPLEGTALPVDKYDGYVVSTFLSYNNFVPREVGEPLKVSFFRIFYNGRRFAVEAVFRRELGNIDEVLDLTTMETPFDIVKTDTIPES
jgi:hypothetical protein